MLRSLSSLGFTKLLEKPTDHPETAENLNFGVEVLRQRRRVGGHKRHHLDVLRPRGVDGRGGAAGHTGDVRFKRAHPQHLTGLVRSAGDHRHALWYTGRRGCLGRDSAQCLPDREERGQHVAFDRHAVPFPI